MFTGICPVVKLCSDLRKAGPTFLADPLTLTQQTRSTAELMQRDPQFLVYSPRKDFLHKSLLTMTIGMFYSMVVLLFATDL